MKKIFMMAVMAVAALTANAQNEVGQFTLMPKAGINISTITGDILYEKKSKVGFVGGVEAEVLPNGWTKQRISALVLISIVVLYI